MSETAATPDDASEKPHLPLTPADEGSRKRLAGWFSALVSLALLVVVALQFRKLELGQVVELIPNHAGFWVFFAAYYLALPVSEWLIYRRMWPIPFLSGIAALLRKLVSNELLLGYLGEAQFYGWARSHLKMEAAPFGAIKDVTILSALTGNIMTLVMLVFAWPLVASGQIGMEMKSTFLSLGVILVTSFAILLFRQKLFTLPKRDLWFISLVHVLRILVVLGCSAVMWHLVLPDVSVTLWIVLATLRMLLSRLPLLPNKDVVFAGLAVFLLGHEVQIASLMTLMAAMLLVAHLCVGAIFGAVGLLDSRSEK